MKNRSEYNRIYATKRRAKEREKEFSKIFELLDGCCAYCGDSVKFHSFHIDHVQSKHRGGKDYRNRTVSCRTCNCRKTYRNLEEFRTHEIRRRLEMIRIPDSMADYLLRLGLDLREAERQMVASLEHVFYFERQGLSLSDVIC